jgi:hypothetical protein
LVEQMTWSERQNFMYPSLDMPRNVVFCIPRKASRFYLQELLLFVCCHLQSSVTNGGCHAGLG